MSQSFRTIVEPLKYRGLINHRQGIVMMGSCFSDNIGAKLEQAYFDVEINPFGTLYNPASIACGIDDLLNKRLFNKSDLIRVDGDNRWHSFSHHSSFSKVSAEDMLVNINQQIENVHQAICKASVLIITFGTAWVYEHNVTQKVVANCHKLPASNFNRRLMSVDEIVIQWQNVIERLRRLNKDIRIIFTVSPIRHLRDGAHENQISKSILLLAINDLIKKDNQLIYFPAYEVMNDDLRDYRFYASDMTHPSEIAVDYIYDLFSKSFFNDETLKLAVECRRLYRRLQHRPMSDDVEAVTRFETATQELQAQMLCLYPFLEKTLMKNHKK